LDEQVIISIADDGIGINEKPGKENHYGIEIMNQRATELNAILEIKSLPVGTEIKLIFAI
jgi:nitrate/nitrite-specific signal transduction histidine kinase